MPSPSTFRTIGVYIPQELHDAMADDLYEKAGCVELESYFDTTRSTIPRGDPVAESTAVWCHALVSEFATLYDMADFDRAATVDPTAFVLTTLAASPTAVYELRDRFDAASIIQDRETRVVQTAILRVAFDQHAFPPVAEGCAVDEMVPDSV